MGSYKITAGQNHVRPNEQVNSLYYGGDTNPMPLHHGIGALNTGSRSLQVRMVSGLQPQTIQRLSL